jgi:subtilisin family serine protease
VIKEEANYSIPPCWDLEGAHGIGIDGEGITIAVLDSGINRNHAAFAETTLSGKNFIDRKRDDYWCTNREAHGTMVTGIITKYAPKAEIYVCCVSEENKFKPRAIVRALKHLKKSYEDEHDISDKKKCQVIVMSFGHYNREEYPERKELITNLASKGVICVAAIGNYGLYADQLAYPALLDEVIAVGGLTEFGHESAQFNPPGKIDVYAPGEAVCFPADTSNSNYRKGGGTSCAAPAIGGIVALLMQLARRSGDELNNTKSIKRIFSLMKREVITTTSDGKGEMVEVPNPKYFFGEYGTPDKFQDFLRRCTDRPACH